MARPNAVNNYTTTLNGAITNSATSATVIDTVPSDLVVPFKVRFVAEGANTDEIATVTAMSGTGNKTWTIARATETWNGVQTGSAHANAARVEHNFTAGTLADAWSQGTGFIGARAYNSTTQTAVNTTVVKLELDTEDYDTDGFHDTVTNNSRMTIPAGLGGKYLCIAAATWTDTNATGQRIVGVFKNNATVGGHTTSVPYAAFQARQSSSVVLDLISGDYVEGIVYQDSGGTRQMGGVLDISSQFTIVKLDSGRAGSGIGASVSKTALQTLTNNTETAVTFDTADTFDTDGFHNPASNSSRLVIPTGLGGKYLVTSSVDFASNATGNRYTRFRKNGATDLGFYTKGTPQSSNTFLTATGVFELVAGDYVEIIALQSSGGNLDIEANSAWAAIVRLDSGTSAYTGPRWGAGTAFPSGPVTNDRFTRTDRKLDYFWDGSQWLTTTLYREHAGSIDALSPIGVDATMHRFTIWHTTYDMYVENFYVSFFIPTTNNGSNYWTVELKKYTAANTGTTIATFNSSADAASTWITKEASVAAVVSSATYKQLQSVYTKTGTPGSIYCPVAFTYRLVG